MMRLVAMRVLARMAAEGYVHSARWPLGPIRASAGTVTKMPLKTKLNQIPAAVSREVYAQAIQI